VAGRGKLILLPNHEERFGGGVGIATQDLGFYGGFCFNKGFFQNSDMVLR
jgi:hypothetical protein